MKYIFASHLRQHAESETHRIAVPGLHLSDSDVTTCKSRVGLVWCHFWDLKALKLDGDQRDGSLEVQFKSTWNSCESILVLMK